MVTVKTLGEYRDFCVTLAGDNNAAVKYFDDRIAEQGRDEAVLADDSQMLMLIAHLLKTGGWNA